MYKTRKKLISLILVILLLITGCRTNDKYILSPYSTTEPAETTIDNKEDITEETTKDTSNDISEEDCNYSFSIYDSEKEYTQDELKTQDEFSKLLDEIFIDEMSSNTLNLHFMIEDPSSYGIDDFDPTWGGSGIDDFEDAQGDYKDVLNDIQSFDYESLNYEQQLIYDLTTEYINNYLSGGTYFYFESAFSPGEGIQSQIPIIFTEYDFLEKSDIDDYISLLEQSYDYISSLCEYELYRKDQGQVISSYGIDTVISQCNDFINSSPNPIVTIFNEDIESFKGLTDKEITSYKTKVKEGVEKYLIPAYQMIIETLTDIEKSNIEKKGLSQYENGDEYYAYVVKSKTGSDKSPKELITSVQGSIDSMLARLYAISFASPELLDEIETYQPSISDPDEMIKHYFTALEKDFPEAVCTDYDLKYVHPALQDTLNPAFYIVPPIDDPYKNTIYINESEDYANMPLFQTIAHETVPGHMYQSNYFSFLDPDKFRYILSFNGY